MQAERDAIAKINIVLAELVDETTHTAARQHLLEIIAKAAGYDFAFFVELEEDKLHMRVVSVHIPKKTLRVLEKITGFSLLGYRYPIEVETVLDQPSTEVFEHFSDFHVLIPQKVGSAIGKAVGLKSIVSIRQRTQDTYLGAVNFFATKSNPNLELLETLCNNHLVFALRLMQEQTSRARQKESYTRQLEKSVIERTAELEISLARSQAAEEKISEHYLDLVQTRAELEERVLEEQNLLKGFQTLLTTGSVSEIFEGILNFFQDVFVYENAFILAKNDSGEMRPLASTTIQYNKTRWQPASFFERVLSGETIAAYNTDLIPEWKMQPQSVRNNTRSALHIPLVTSNTSAMLVCVHPEIGFFAKKHIQLAQRFSVIALQALYNVELLNQLKQERDSLEEVVVARTADLEKLNQELLEENAERRLAEDVARESETRYRSLFERTSDAVFFLNLDGIHLDANQQAVDMLGYELNELIGMSIEDIIAQREYPNSQKMKAALLAKESVPVYERIFRKKDGTEFPVEINAAVVYDPDDQPLHIQSVVRDITGRKRAEADIINLAKFPSENPSAVLRVTSTGEILYANPSSSEILSFWGTNVGEILPSSILDDFIDSSGNSQKNVTELIINDRVFALSFVQVKKMGYINIYGRDITAEKEADRVKTEFIASISHELLTPLAACLGYAEILLEGDPGELTETQAEFLNIIYESSYYLTRIVNDLLDATKMEAGRFELKFGQINLEPIIHKTVNRIKPIALKKGVNLKVELPSVFPELNVDGARIEQVIINLLSNAIKFTPSGGDVILEVELKEDARLIIRVKDTGIGIPQDDLPKLFDHFYRGKNVLSENIEGTGLGLYISKAIVEGHQGQIFAYSELGKGSQFEVIIPIK